MCRCWVNINQEWRLGFGQEYIETWVQFCAMEFVMGLCKLCQHKHRVYTQMYTSVEKVLNKNSGIRHAKKGQKQVADV